MRAGTNERCAGWLSLLLPCSRRVAVPSWPLHNSISLARSPRHKQKQKVRGGKARYHTVCMHSSVHTVYCVYCILYTHGTLRSVYLQGVLVDSLCMYCTAHMYCTVQQQVLCSSYAQKKTIINIPDARRQQQQAVYS